MSTATSRSLTESLLLIAPVAAVADEPEAAGVLARLTVHAGSYDGGTE